ncbi:MAG: hypothetical protein N2254_09820, partial [bacterium]|nr:hypothetical protein [bacterium]
HYQEGGSKMNEGIIIAVIIALLSFLVKNAVEVFTALKMIRYKETEFKLITEIELIKKDIEYIKETIKILKKV